MSDKDRRANPSYSQRETHLPSSVYSDGQGTLAGEGETDNPVSDEPEAESGLFDELLETQPIFTDKEKLRPSYTPSELPHREDQLTNLATILASALRGDTPSNILVYGKTGTGKTASAKYVSQELAISSEKHDVPCEIMYINCKVTDTKYRVLAQLANEFIEKDRELVKERIDHLTSLRNSINRGEITIDETEFSTLQQLSQRISELQHTKQDFTEVPMTGWPTDRVYSELFDALDYRERVAIVILDEIDRLVEKSGDDALYNLTRMNSDLDSARLSIVGISNDLKFTEFLDPRVKSSLGEEEIVFPPYDAGQLADILNHRAEEAFKSGVISDGVISLCAALAAQEHGDARRALDLLRTAGEITERQPEDQIKEAHVKQAQEKLELNRIVEVVTTLPTQSKIVLYAIVLLEKHHVQDTNTGRVYNTYKHLCEHLDADTLTQRRVTDLIDELDMLGIVNAVVISKGRYGRTKEINLSAPLDELERVLESDSRLAALSDFTINIQSRLD